MTMMYLIWIVMKMLMIKTKREKILKVFEEENFDESDFHLSEEEDPLAKLKSYQRGQKEWEI